MKLSYISLKNVNFLVQHDQNTKQHILQTFIFTYASSKLSFSHFHQLDKQTVAAFPLP